MMKKISYRKTLYNFFLTIKLNWKHQEEVVSLSLIMSIYYIINIIK